MKKINLTDKEKWKISFSINIKAVLILLVLALIFGLLGEIGYLVVLLIPIAVFLLSSIFATKYFIDRGFKPKIIPYLIVFSPLMILSLIFIVMDFLIKTTYHTFLLTGIVLFWLPFIALIVHFIIRIFLIRRYKS